MEVMERREFNLLCCIERGIQSCVGKEKRIQSLMLQRKGNSVLCVLEKKGIQSNVLSRKGIQSVV